MRQNTEEEREGEKSINSWQVPPVEYFFPLCDGGALELWELRGKSIQGKKG